MPYFVFEIHPPRRLEAAGVYDEYREARAAVRALRRAHGNTGSSARMIHAPTPEAARRLLLERREPRPLGEDA